MALDSEDFGGLSTPLVRRTGARMCTYSQSRIIMFMTSKAGRVETSECAVENGSPGRRPAGVSQLAGVCATESRDACTHADRSLKPSHARTTQRDGRQGGGDEARRMQAPARIQDPVRRMQDPGDVRRGPPVCGVHASLRRDKRALALNVCGPVLIGVLCLAMLCGERSGVAGDAQRTRGGRRSPGCPVLSARIDAALCGQRMTGSVGWGWWWPGRTGGERDSRGREANLGLAGWARSAMSGGRVGQFQLVASGHAASGQRWVQLELLGSGCPDSQEPREHPSAVQNVGSGASTVEASTVPSWRR